MLTLRILQLVGAGFSLLAISRFLEFMYGLVHRADRLMMKPFFNVAGLTDEIRCMAAQRQNLPLPEGTGGCDALLESRLYRWLCNRLRRANGLGPLRPPPGADR